MGNGVLLQINKSCNLKCTHCSQNAPSSSVKSDLSISDWIDIMHFAKEQGHQRIRFTGGEPFLKKDLAILISEAYRLGLDYSLISNCNHISKSNFEELCRFPPSSIWASLYSYPEENYESITTVKGSYARVRENITRLISSGIAVGIYYPVDNNNYGHVEAMVRDYLELGIRKFKFLQVLMQGRAVDNKTHEQLNPQQLEGFLDSIISLTNSYPQATFKVAIHSGQTAIFKKKKFILPAELGCNIDFTNLWSVSSSGDLHLCCLAMNENKNSLLNLKKGKYSPHSLTGLNRKTCSALDSYPENDFACPLLYAQYGI